MICAHPHRHARTKTRENKHRVPHLSTHTYTRTRTQTHSEDIRSPRTGSGGSRQHGIACHSESHNRHDQRHLSTPSGVSGGQMHATYAREPVSLLCPQPLFVASHPTGAGSGSRQRAWNTWREAHMHTRTHGVHVRDMHTRTHGTHAHTLVRTHEYTRNQRQGDLVATLHHCKGVFDSTAGGRLTRYRHNACVCVRVCVGQSSSQILTGQP